MNQPDLSRTVYEDYHINNPVIETSVMHEFTTCCNRLMELKYPWMGVITGYAGVGKTAAIDFYIKNSPTNKINGHRYVLKVVSSDDSTRKTVAIDLAKQMGVDIKGNFTKKIREALEMALRANLIQMILVDESDQSRKEVFEFFRMLRDNAGVRIIFIGLPSLMEKLKKHPQIDSRTRPSREMLTIDLDECLDLIFPKIKMDRFDFDPRNEAHRILGKKIFNVTHGNFRDVLALLDSASYFARICGHPQITTDDITDAIIVDHNFSNTTKTEKDSGGPTYHEDTAAKRQGGKK